MKIDKTDIQHLMGHFRAFAILTGSFIGAVLLSGCAFGNGADTKSGPVPLAGAALQGRLQGGQQPVSAATIQLYAAGASGYGSAATPLITSNAQSDANGNFNITGTYTCPSSSSQVYIVASGGNPGAGPNINLKMMAALGPCGTLVANAATTFIFINEITTVGSVWALAPFMTGPANIGTSSSNGVGLMNAFADVNTLVNTTTGATPGPAAPTGATLPISEINTLADIVASCVNSGGGSAGDGSACGNLFSAANPGGTMATAPTDTLTAAMNVAQHPGLNVSSLYVLAPSSAPFQPTLSTQPKDFTIAVSYANAAFSGPSAMAADSQGNVWVTNSVANTVSKLAHTGAVSASYSGLNLPSAVAVDASDGVWIINKGNNTVSHLTSAGNGATGSPYSGGGLNQPNGVSLDNAGNAWISNSNASVTELSRSGAALSPGTGYTAVGVTAPIGIAVSPH